MANKAQLHLTRPKDRSLEAYKKWITDLVGRVNPGDTSTLSDSEWKTAHQKFWEKVDNTPKK